MIHNVELTHLQLPMEKKFGHNLAEHSTTDNLILKIQGDGCFGVGEAVPRKFVTGESSQDVLAQFPKSNAIEVLQQFNGYLKFNDVAMALRQLELGSRKNDNFLGPAIACLLELALLDYFGKKHNCSVDTIFRQILYDKMPSIRISRSFPISTVISYSDSLDERLKGKKIHFIKLKVGHNIEKDIEQIERIQKMVDESVPISVDGNRCWNYQEGIRFSEKCKIKNIRIAWMEEPLNTKDYKELASFRKETGNKIMLDEGCICMEDLVEASKNNAFDYINLRISKNGGVFHLMNMYRFVVQNGYQAQLGVHVGEIGPLWACGRKLMQAGLSVQAYEAGQADLLIKNYSLNDEFGVERIENYANSLDRSGLGIENFGKFLREHSHKSLRISILNNR